VGDVLEVETFDQEEVSGEFAIEPTGAIIFPLLGTVSVAGLTPREVSATLEKLLELGVITRIETDETAITHYVSEPFIALPDDVVEEYARAAFVHHIHNDSGTPKPVVLRDTTSGRRIAVRDQDGNFQRF